MFAGAARGADLRSAGGHTSIRRTVVVVAGLLTAPVLSAAAQRAPVQPDSSHAQIRTVLRAFYSSMARQGWQALSAYVLSPKLLERLASAGADEFRLLYFEERWWFI